MKWLALASAVAGVAVPTLHLKVGPAPLRVGTPVPIVVRGPFSTVRVDALSPSGRVARVSVQPSGRNLWRGRFRFDRAGRWLVRAFSGGLRASVSVVIRPALPTSPPSGFGPLGATGCAPPSPRSGVEVFGTTTGGRFWALFGFNPGGVTWHGDQTAALDGLVGKEIKIVFKLTAGQPSTFYGVAPDGSRTKPVWGPTPHGSSSWRRHGAEWGAGFVFAGPGCWRIHAARGAAGGDLFLDVRS
jgi:hypothetical protein